MPENGISRAVFRLADSAVQTVAGIDLGVLMIKIFGCKNTKIMAKSDIFVITLQSCRE
jgi:hypothetical protein